VAATQTKRQTDREAVNYGAKWHGISREVLISGCCYTAAASAVSMEVGDYQVPQISSEIYSHIPGVT